MARDEYGGERPGRRGDAVGWHRDEKGRKYRESAGARVYETQEDRDQALEEQYVLGCGTPDDRCCTSLLMHVVRHGPKLVDEYMAWVRDDRFHHAYAEEPMRQWQVKRFGGRAYKAAHCQLMFQVRVAVFGSLYRKRDKGAA